MAVDMHDDSDVQPGSLIWHLNLFSSDPQLAVSRGRTTDNRVLRHKQHSRTSKAGKGTGARALWGDCQDRQNRQDSTLRKHTDLTPQLGIENGSFVLVNPALELTCMKRSRKLLLFEWYYWQVRPLPRFDIAIRIVPRWQNLVLRASL